MDMDTTINELAYALWTIAHEQEDVATTMMEELDSFAAAVRADERTACAAVCDDVGMEFYWAHNLQAETGAHECYLRILERNKPTETKAEDSQNV